MRPVSPWIAGTALALAVACGSDRPPANPGGPSPPPPPPPSTPSELWSVEGTVTTTLSGAPVANARVSTSIGGEAVVTDGQGRFRLSGTTNPNVTAHRLTIEASGYVTRELWLTWQAGARTGLTLDIIAQRAPFTLTLYRELARNAYESDTLQRLWIWRGPPSFYVRTVDENGRAIEASVINTIVSAIRSSVPAFTAGKYRVAALETGRERRGSRAGWVNVDIRRRVEENYCGLAYIGSGPIILRYDGCSCGSTKVSPDVVMHEVGHVMGFFHVSNRRSVMFPYDSPSCRPAALTAAEQHHVAVAYARTRGNRDPDRDPESAARITEPILVVN